MWVPRVLARGFSRDPASFLEGERAVSTWWARRRSQIPANAWAAGTAAVGTAIGFVVVGPVKDPSNFYGIAAQVVPAFLIALAVERSLLDSLGTKADFARARRDETTDSYAEPGLNGGVRNVIELALLAREREAIQEKRQDLLSVSVGPLDVAQAAFVGHWDDDAMAWQIFRSLLHDEFGLEEDDPDFFEAPKHSPDPTPAFDALRDSVVSPAPGRGIRWLAAHAALREDRNFSGGTVGAQIVAAELNRLFEAQRTSGLESVLKRVTHRANLDYDRQRKHRTLSLRISIILLTTTEFLALIGVMSPGRPYSLLFVVTAALVAASVINVAGGAFSDLAGARHP